MHAIWPSILNGCEGVGTWDWDLASDIVHADPSIAPLFGLDPAVAQAGAPVAAFAASVHPEDREEVLHRLYGAAAEGGAYVAEYRVRAVDGATRRVLARGCFELDASGRPMRGRGIIVDTTGSRLEGSDATRDVDAPGAHPLERAVDHCLATREAITEVKEPFLLKLTDMLLLELGRGLGRLAKRERTRRMI
ncbi:PAS domain-containing protein [Methylobacterium crusticola]|uniref:PAS domain-containing protein n=1 Tax=Methylobacterium crusticola TaxID=1697972 RepID=UPI001396C8B4|nr:PAS domain-containing protein [Methylobacterium crusticola]